MRQYASAPACRGHRDIFGLYPGESNFPRFTAWLGSNSSAGKQKRLAGELTTKLLAAGANADRRDLRLQYLPVLRLALTAPLVEHEAEGIPKVIDLMQNYLISRCAAPGNTVLSSDASCLLMPVVI